MISHRLFTSCAMKNVLQRMIVDIYFSLAMEVYVRYVDLLDAFVPG
jgi:hypothetical protein